MNKIHILNFNHLGGKTGSARLIDTLMMGLPIDQFRFHNLVGYGFFPQKNTTSLYQTNPSWIYRNLRYKLAVGTNFLLDWMTPGCVRMEYLRRFEPYQQADIIHLHCVQGGYFDWSILPEISREKKIIMTLHDDWLVSGNDPNNLFHPYKTQSQYLKRREIFEKCDISYIGVSNWITDKIQRDGIAGKNPVKTIYNGIDTNIFFPQNKNTCRKELGLPLDKKIIISIAGSGGKSNAKGLAYVNRIMEDYKDQDDYLFITLGNFENKKVSATVWEMGYVSRDMVAKYFSSADVFLYPTIMDSFGLVIAESLACGCPVVTFQTGGTAEIVQHGQDGYVAKHKDYDDLRTGFDIFIDREPTRKILLDKKFTKEKMVQSYVDEYCIMLDKGL